MLVLDYYFQSPIDKTDNWLTLDELVGFLTQGKQVELRYLDTDGVKMKVKFRSKRTGKHNPDMYIHGVPAENVEQVLSYLSGDAHDVSKVQWFDGERFHNFVKDPNEFARIR